MLRRSVALLTCCLTLGLAPAGRADLPGYVGKADPAFKWEFKGKSDSPLGTVYDLTLVSQVWQGITWEHGLQVYVPSGVSPTATMFLWNQGGKPSQGSAIFGLTLAGKIKANLNNGQSAPTAEAISVVP